MFIDSMDFIENILKDRKKITIVIIIIILPVILSLILTQPNLSQIFTRPQPQKEVKIEYTPQPAVEPSLQKGPYKCPSEPTFCNKNNEITRGGKYEGIGGDLPEAAPVYAAFDGEMTALPVTLPPEQGSEKYIIIYLDNRERGLRAVYTLQAKAPEPKTVKEGDIIARIGTKVSIYDSPLVFKLIKGDPLLGEAVKLKAEDFQ